ncbi:hypothetical protein K440DRAFT_95587 [Wilcoxina mikolae CBS 423.85]|nr:hypothetical protein K440DRAFT_95587 [Wilcoxina mikolae CBS 423.85]
MLKPLLACPLPLRSLPIYSFPSLQVSSAHQLPGPGSRSGSGPGSGPGSGSSSSSSSNF